MGWVVWMSWMKWSGKMFTMQILKCTIETQLRSFYFKMFHRAICTNQFLHKIGRTDSPNCYFCKKFPETLFHLFCECEKVTPLWDDLCFLINNISGESFDFSNFEKNVWSYRFLRAWLLYFVSFSLPQILYS